MVILIWMVFGVAGIIMVMLLHIALETARGPLEAFPAERHAMLAVNGAIARVINMRRLNAMPEAAVMILFHWINIVSRVYANGPYRVMPMEEQGFNVASQRHADRHEAFVNTALAASQRATLRLVAPGAHYVAMLPVHEIEARLPFVLACLGSGVISTVCAVGAADLGGHTRALYVANKSAFLRAGKAIPVAVR